MKTYKIMHQYDIGDRGVYIESSFNPVDVAVYIQFKAECLLSEDTSLSNFAIASALINLYKCKSGSNIQEAEVIDMYIERESRCGEWYDSKEGFLSPEIQRTNFQIIKALAPHLDDN